MTIGQKAGSGARVWEDLLETQAESLQVADSVDRVVEIVRRTLSMLPGLGKGAIFLIPSDDEVRHVESVEGPRSPDLAAPRIELIGMARRALRERKLVRQSGVSAGVLWAAPLTSPSGIHGIVAAVGEHGMLPRFLAHAGLALSREIGRREEGRLRRDAEQRALDLERAVEVLDTIAREGGTEPVLRRITGAFAGLPGIGRAALWTLRAEDGVYVEVARAENGSPGGDTEPLAPPAGARRSEALREWCGSLPRFSGMAWVPAGTIERPRPGPGDTLFVPMPGEEGRHLLGFLLAEVTGSLETPSGTEDLLRWARLGRLALECRSDRSRSLASLEELREEKEQISQLHQLKSQFIAAVSHELRTPLTSITAYAETLRSPQVKTDTETRQKFLGVIHDESRRLTRIVDDILDLATLDSGRVRISSRLIDLVKVIEDALDVIRPIAEEKGIRIEHPPFEPAPVHADADLLKQLTVNLVENSVKFSEEGGVVHVDLERDSTAVRMIVRDDGPGIPADKLDAIFDRFYQVDDKYSRRHGGSGLGLAICKSIVTWHDGRIWAESEAGQGARFVVSLPRIRARSRSRAEQPILADQEPEANRIPELIIEMVSEVMGADTVSLMLLDEPGDELFIQAAMGIPDEAIRDARVSVGDRISGSVVKSGKTLHIPDLDRDERFRSSREDQYRTRSLVSVPIRLRDKTIGVINVTNKTSGRAFSGHDCRLLEILAQRVALVLQKLRDYGDQRDGVRRVEEAIRGVIDVRRHYLPDAEGYSELVLAVCEELGIDAEQTARIHYASILRDVGMTRLPEGVYKKPAGLSRDDREQIRRHPEEGARVLRPIEFLPDVFDIILSHHEEPDGTGYPRGLTDPGIPKGAKILAVIDAYSSLRAGRPYRKAVDMEAAVRELRKYSGRQFDRGVVDALVTVLTKRGELPEDRSERVTEDRDPKVRGRS